MNLVNIASIKRSGMNAITGALAQGGPAYLVKHNRAGHVILTREHYERLLKTAESMPLKMPLKNDSPAPGTIQWMLAQPLREGGLTDAEMKLRLAELREGWDER